MTRVIHVRAELEKLTKGIDLARGIASFAAGLGEPVPGFRFVRSQISGSSISEHRFGDFFLGNERSAVSEPSIKVGGEQFQVVVPRGDFFLKVVGLPKGVDQGFPEGMIGQAQRNGTTKGLEGVGVVSLTSEGHAKHLPDLWVVRVEDEDLSTSGDQLVRGGGSAEGQVQFNPSRLSGVVGNEFASFVLGGHGLIHSTGEQCLHAAKVPTPSRVRLLFDGLGEGFGGSRVFGLAAEGNAELAPDFGIGWLEGQVKAIHLDQLGPIRSGHGLGCGFGRITHRCRGGGPRRRAARHPRN